MGEQDGDTSLFSECKWTNEKVDLNIPETFTERSRLFSYKNRYFRNRKLPEGIGSGWKIG